MIFKRIRLFDHRAATTSSVQWAVFCQSLHFTCGVGTKIWGLVSSNFNGSTLPNWISKYKDSKKIVFTCKKKHQKLELIRIIHIFFVISHPNRFTSSPDVFCIERIVKYRKIDRSIIKMLKEHYEYRDEITGERIGSEYAMRHVIRWICFIPCYHIQNLNPTLTLYSQ